MMVVIISLALSFDFLEVPLEIRKKKKQAGQLN